MDDDDLELDDWYRSGAGLHWCWPKVEVELAKDRPRMALTRIPHSTIGAEIMAFGRCVSVRWKA